MKKSNRIWVYSIIVIGFVLIFTNNCKKDQKKDPVLTWENPADISFGTLLSAAQLNAKADVPGTFTYVPAIGTKLNEGTNQDLKVDFMPTDVASYNTATKTVKINVTRYGTMSDQDGNVYKTISIGSQTWMAENLKVTKYNNGATIPNVTNKTEWCNLTTGAYCYYDNDPVTYKVTYGALYNWHAVNSSNLCPTGWHVSTNAEWESLVSYLYGVDAAGADLKETGTIHWRSPNFGATNDSGFTALPGGMLTSDYYWFIDIRQQGYWWTTTSYNVTKAWFCTMYYYDQTVFNWYYLKTSGFSVRCVKN